MGYRTLLAAATQDDIDTWHAQARNSHKHAARAFLTWAINSRLMPKLALPPLRTPNTGGRITQSRRLALLRRILTDEQRDRSDLGEIIYWRG